MKPGDAFPSEIVAGQSFVRKFAVVGFAVFA